MADESLAVLLRTHTGMSDVDDLLAVCASLADEDCATYLQAFISDTDTADAVAAQIVAARSGGEQTTGATTTEATSPSPSLAIGKKGEVEEFFAGKPGKPGKAKAKGTAAAAASVVGGASAVAARKKTKKVSANIDGLDRALLAGRLPCNCNARKHELLYNCLSCGKVICAQEGPN